MSVSGQFKRIGERGVAYGLWGLIIGILTWILKSPLRFFVFSIIFVIAGYTLVSIATKINNVNGETFYVHTNKIEFYDNPFGKKVNTLVLNDSLILIKKMSDNWKKVLVNKDTLYFEDGVFTDPKRGFQSSKIDMQPLTKYDILIGNNASINHPNGYFDNGIKLIKNGTIVKIEGVNVNSKSVEFLFEHVKVSIPIKYLKINWDKVLTNYPNIN